MPDQTLEYLSSDVPISADATLPPLTPDDGATSLEGQAIGLPEVPGYEIISELGRGGMGVVYKARQKGLGRIVALKMVLAGAHAGAAQLARFQAEAEAIARIQHPHIVQIYEVNTANVGSGTACPYMALEFVSGGGLETYLNGKPLLPRQSAALVQALADAMQQAHEKGVVHRDLKPGNVLLALHAAGPTIAVTATSVTQQSGRSGAAIELAVDGATLKVIPKITDFGLAEQMESKTGQTVSGAVLGTPSYMAPEQAEGQSKEVGPAADIYALGVILYEMLTGRVPFQGTTVMETIIQVMNSEPVPPAALQPSVPKDLDTICLKCLAKEPARRYASAAALAEDLRRFLNDEPILARPVSSIEKARRWCRRNPRIALLLAALAVTFFGGFAAVTYSWRQAVHLREEAQTQQALAQAQRDRAEHNYERARRTVHHFYQEVTENPLLREPGQEPVRNKLLEGICAFYEEFSAERIDDERLLEELARTMSRLAQMRSDLDTKARAAEAAHRAVLLWERLVEKYPTKWEFLGELAYVQWLQGRMHRLDGNRDAAVASYEKALAKLRRLNDAQPDVPKYQADLARCTRGLAYVTAEVGQWAEAERLFLQALDIMKQLTRKYPGVPEHRRDLSVTYYGLGTLTGDAPRLARAEEACRQALILQERLVLDNPDVAQYGQDLALSHAALGQVYLKTQRWAEATAALENARQVNETLLEKHPAFPDFLRELARTCMQLAELHLRADLSGAARARAQQALDLLAHGSALPDVAKLRGQGYYVWARIEADIDAELALELLAQAKKVGHFKDKKNQEALQMEKDFAPLRMLPEFQGLLRDQ